MADTASAPPPPDPPQDATPSSTVPQKPSKAPPKTTATSAATASSLLAPRHIPGAPPPDPSKEKAPRRRNKKKPAITDDSPQGGSPSAPPSSVGAPRTPLHLDQPLDAALTERAPASEDLNQGRVASQLVATEDDLEKALAEDLQPEVESDDEQGLEEWKVLKKSAALGVLRTKLKKLEGRLERTQTQQKSGKPDPLVNVKEKPVEGPAYLEGLIHEFKELETAIEEEESKRQANQEQLLRNHRLADRRKNRLAVKEAVGSAKAETYDKVNVVLSFLALSNGLSTGSLAKPFTIPVSDEERVLIGKAASLLVEDDGPRRADLIRGLLCDKAIGDFHGIPFARLRALTKSYGQPISPISSPPPEADGDHALRVQVNGLAPPPMQFTTASELDQASFTVGSASLEDVHGVSVKDAETATRSDPQAEIVDGSSLPSAAEIQQEWVEVRTEPQVLPVPATADEGAFDWAADDLDPDLPPLDTLHAKFGTSGDATPTSPAPDHTPEQPLPADVPAHRTVGVPPKVPNPVAPKAGDDGDWITARPFRKPPALSPPADIRGRGGRGGSGFRGGDRGSRGGGGEFRSRGSNFRPPRGEAEGAGGFSRGWRDQNAEGVTRGDAPRGRGGFRPGRGGDWGNSGERRGRGGFRGRGGDSVPPSPVA